MTNVIAIDGPVGSGKSTVARSLAARLGWSFLDTGAMYRAVTLAAQRAGLNLDDDDLIGELAEASQIETLPVVTLNGEDVTDSLRTPNVNAGVSHVAALARVRRALVQQQQRFAQQHPAGVVVEGRDITTVVFPDARLKVFLTASEDERARRRGDEGAHSVRRRDEIDTGRDTSPLRIADDAKMVDTTGRSVEDVVEEILGWLAPST